MSYSRRSRHSLLPSPYGRHSCSVSPRGRSLSRSPSRSRESSAENPGNNLYVTGLSSHVTRRDLEKHFSIEGKVEDIHLVTDPWTRESRGFGFVTMSTLKEADRCIKYLNRSVLEGRVITVEKARRSRGRTSTPGRYLGLRAVRGRRRSPSYSPNASDRERSYSPSPYYQRDRSYSPYYYSRSSYYNRSPVRHCAHYDSPADRYYRRSRYRSPSWSYSPRRRRSYSRSYSPRPSRSSRRRRRYSRSYSNRPSRRSYSRSYSTRPRRSSRRSPSYSYSHSSRRGRSYSRSASPRPRKGSARRYDSPEGGGQSCDGCSSRSYSSRSAPSRSRSRSKSARSASPSA